MSTRARRSDRGAVRWTERDERVLRWIGSQYIIRQDQLAELAGRWPGKDTHKPGRLGATTVRALVRRWRLAGVVESRKVLVRQPIWCCLTPSGQILFGVEARPWEPSIHGERALAHRYYVNQVRLWVEQAYPEATWTSERELLHGQRARRKGEETVPVPDAEVQLGGRTIAIEVELHAKTEERWQEILAERAARYDQVWYFTSAQLRRDLGRALDTVEPKVRTKFSLSLVNEAAYRLERPSS